MPRARERYERVIDQYRGYQIEATRDRCLAGYYLIYYCIVRLADDRIVVDTFTEAEPTLKGFVKDMRKRIDAEEGSDNPWGLREDDLEDRT